MIWLGALGLLLAIAVAAAVLLLRGGSGRAAPEEPRIERRRGAADAPPKPAGVGDQLREAVARQRERAGRLTAGHVQLIDVGAMIEGATAAGLPPAKALAVAEEVARRMTRAADVLVRMEPDGLAILFDGASRAEAEAKSRQIAEATLAALGEVGSGGRYLAEGFGYELDEVLDGAVIDTVDDLVRFVHIAHRAYVAKQRGLARQLERGVRLESREILAGKGGVAIGLQIAVLRSADAGTSRDDSFAAVDPPTAAEIDCVVLEKLATTAAGWDEPLYVPARLSSLTNPLYFGNLRAALDALPPTMRQRLVLVVDPGAGQARTLLPRARELLRTRVAGVAARVGDPGTDIAAANAAGIGTVVLDDPERRFAEPLDIVTRFRAQAREAGMTAIVLGAGEAVAGLPGGIAHSRAAAG